MIFVKPLKVKDLSIFEKWVESYRRKKINFVYKRDLKEGYLNWFYEQKKRRRDFNYWLICYYKDKKVGAINYCGDIDECEVSIFLAPRWTKKGLGKLFLFLGENWVLKKKKIKYFWCEPLNIECRKTFEINGFEGHYNFMNESTGDLFKII